jgi:hypothetical protein
MCLLPLVRLVLFHVVRLFLFFSPTSMMVPTCMPYMSCFSLCFACLTFCHLCIVCLIFNDFLLYALRLSYYISILLVFIMSVCPLFFQHTMLYTLLFFFSQMIHVTAIPSQTVLHQPLKCTVFNCVNQNPFSYANPLSQSP